MAPASDYCVVLTNCPTYEEGTKLAAALVEQKLAAAVQMVAATSFYTWDGRMNQTAEQILLIKTSSRRYQEVEAYIRSHHSYELPAIVRIPIEGGLEEYVQWIDASTAKAGL